MQDERFFKETIEGTSFDYDDTLEYAPAGTEIHFHVVKQDMNSDVLDANDEFRYSTTVNANGTYSIDIPTIEEGLNVDISFDDFAYNYQYWEVDNYEVAFILVPNPITLANDTVFGDTTFFYSSRIERKIYSHDDIINVVEVHENENYVDDFTYED
jgi:hypothetical protein